MKYKNPGQNLPNRFLLFCNALLLCGLFFFPGCKPAIGTNLKKHSINFIAMGTYITMSAYGDQAGKALDLSEEKIKELEDLWSVSYEKSEIYRVNNSRGETTQISTETEELLEFALAMAEKTEGAFEPTIYPVVDAWGFTSHQYRIPEKEELAGLLKNTGYKKVCLSDGNIHLPDGVKLDLGAVAKGYAGDMVVDLLKQQGITSALLDIGGNIQLIGKKPDGGKWRIGIRNPFDDGETIGIVEAEDCTVITSGGYERYFTGEDGKKYHHIINPATGYPAESGLASVTIVAKKGRLADVLSTALFVMGLEQATGYWRQHQNFDMILITENGGIHITKSLSDRFSTNGGTSPAVIDTIDAQ